MDTGLGLLVGTAFIGGRDSDESIPEAVREAFSRLSGVPPRLALATWPRSRGSDGLAEALEQAAAGCPLVGFSTHDTDASTEDHGRGLLAVLGSDSLTAAVGLGVESENWQAEFQSAFRSSFVSPPRLMGTAPLGDERVVNSYRYRRPDLVLAFTTGGEQCRAKGTALLSFLRNRFRDEVPAVVVALPKEAELLAAGGGRRGERGTALVVLKSNVPLDLRRLHDFEPLGPRLTVTGTRDAKVLEFDGRPAVRALREALALSGLEEPCDGEFLGIPLALRGRDSRYQMFLPRPGPDGSLVFDSNVRQGAAFHPMVPVMPTSAGGRPAGEKPADGGALELIFRDPRLKNRRDWARESLTSSGSRTIFLDVPPGGALAGHLPGQGPDDEVSHLSVLMGARPGSSVITLQRNEALLDLILRLKDLNERVFESIGYGIAVFDTRLRILHSNAHYPLLTGAANAELRGMECPRDPGTTGGCPTCAVREALSTGRTVSRIIERIPPSPAQWLRIDAFPLREGGTGTGSVVEVIRDVSDTFNLRASLDREKRKLEAVIQGMAEDIYVVNAERRISFIHRPDEWGAEREAEEEHCHRVIFNRKTPCPWCRLEETIRDGRVYREVAEQTGPDGETAFYQITFSPCAGPGGTIDRAVCLIVDITERHLMEQQLVISEKLRSLSVLSAGMAHEIKNPLGAISFNLDLLKNHAEDPWAVGILDSIKRDIARIDRIVKNLHSFSVHRGGTFPSVSLAEVIDSSVELYQSMLNKADVRVSTRFDDGLPPVRGNFQELQQVFGNLISNAVEAMPSGGLVTIEALRPGAPGDGDPVRLALIEEDGASRAGEELARDARFSITRLASPEEAQQSLAEGTQARCEFLLLVEKTGEDQGPGPGVRRLLASFPSLRLIRIRPPVYLPSFLEDRYGPLERLTVPRTDGSLGDVIHGAALDVRRETPEQPLEVVFADTGLGISSPALEHIFDPFHTTKLDIKGTGLGLSVVHRILENHGARVRARSLPGIGTTFHLRFPCVLETTDRGGTANAGKEKR